MADPRARGVSIPPHPTPNELSRILTQLGDQNFMERGIGHGIYGSGLPVGRFDSVYAAVTLATGNTEVVVPHLLGRVPKWARVWEIEAGPSNQVAMTVASTKKTLWTASTVLVWVHLIAGSLDGVRLTLEVGGQV